MGTSDFRVARTGERSADPRSPRTAVAGSRFTAMFEALAIDWLKHASVKAVAQRLRISWAGADGIKQRAVRRGLARRTPVAPRHAGIDETSFQKRHEVDPVRRQEHRVLLAEGDSILKRTK